jgi:hypothetical protein
VIFGTLISQRGDRRALDLDKRESGGWGWRRATRCPWEGKQPAPGRRPAGGSLKAFTQEEDNKVEGDVEVSIRGTDLGAGRADGLGG